MSRILTRMVLSSVGVRGKRGGVNKLDELRRAESKRNVHVLHRPTESRESRVETVARYALISKSRDFGGA